MSEHMAETIGEFDDLLERLSQRTPEYVDGHAVCPADHNALEAVSIITEQCEQIGALQARVQELEQWVNDLQSGMYINCVYCGHRYGSVNEVPATMADVLKEHIESCPKHPMSLMKAENARLREALEPFAEYADVCQDSFTKKLDPEKVGIATYAGETHVRITLADLLRAKAALEPQEETS